MIKIEHTFANNLPKAIAPSLKMLCEQIRADSDQFVPRLSGDLRTFVNINSSDSKGEIVYDSKYAQRQWYGVGIVNYTTAGTGPEWCEVAKNRYGNDWEKVLSKALLENAR